jgi:hypothetical protein
MRIDFLVMMAIIQTLFVLIRPVGRRVPQGWLANNTKNPAGESNSPAGFLLKVVAQHHVVAQLGESNSPAGFLLEVVAQHHVVAQLGESNSPAGFLLEGLKNS